MHIVPCEYFIQIRLRWKVFQSLNSKLLLCGELKSLAGQNSDQRNIFVRVLNLTSLLFIAIFITVVDFD